MACFTGRLIRERTTHRGAAMKVEDEGASAFEEQRDPHPEWAEGRKQCPVRDTVQFGRPTTRVLGYEDVESVLRDSETFSSRITNEVMAEYMGKNLVGLDGEEHTRYRALVTKAFRTAALERWERELIQPTIHELLDVIAPRGRADLVRDITSQYPVKIIAGIVGVPIADHARFQAWAEDINTGPMHPERGRAASRAMREYLTPIVEDRKRNPRDDLISDIATAEIDGEQLDDESIYGFLRLLMPAGAETTFRAMGNLLLALLSQPQTLARVRDDRSLLPRAIEEVVRWEPPVTMVNRVATKDTSVGGCPVAAGSSVHLITASANRDESHFPRGERFDLDRESAYPHLGFGWGRHLCLGMHLARLELKAGLDAILDRLPNLRLDPSAPVPEIVGHAFRGPDSLPVLFDPSSENDRGSRRESEGVVPLR
jgi:cytochrome P450